jgi:hypothetical protein
MQRAQAAAAEAKARYFMLQGKREKAAFLGVSGSPVTPPLREQLKLPRGVGMVIDFVEPKSPADEAGLKQFDVLHKLDDQLVVNAHQLAVLVRMHKPGEEVSVTLIHQGETKQVKVKLAEREVLALDDQSPWGVPPNPFGTGAGIDVRTLKPGWEMGLEGPHVSIRRSGGVGAEAESMRALVEKDGSRLTLHQDKQGKHLTITDPSGKNVFDGPIDTPAQREAVPQEYRDRLKRLESVPSTQPVPPGFGTPRTIRLQTLKDGTVEAQVEGLPFDSEPQQPPVVEERFVQ